jgi:hypothetical protein
LLRKDGSKDDGTEFIKGSAAQIWWSTAGNNPKGLPAGTSYSILIPDEDLRLQLEVLDPTGHETVYFGITDFNPETVQFPLSIKAIRLGDYLSLNTDALTKLPGANLTITAAYNLASIDLAGTKSRAYQLGYSLGFSDIVYNTAGSPITSPAMAFATGNSTIYNGFDGKVRGDVIITINELASASTSANTYTVTVPADKFGIPGKGTMLKLTTTKVGWYDSATVGVNDNDITVETTEIPIN